MLGALLRCCETSQLVKTRLDRVRATVGSRVAAAQTGARTVQAALATQRDATVATRHSPSRRVSRRRLVLSSTITAASASTSRNTILAAADGVMSPHTRCRDQLRARRRVAPVCVARHARETARVSCEPEKLLCMRALHYSLAL